MKLVAELPSPNNPISPNGRACGTHAALIIKTEVEVPTATSRLLPCYLLAPCYSQGGLMAYRLRVDLAS